MTDQTVPQVVPSPTYRITAVRLVFHGASTLCGAILAALTGVKWTTLDGQSKFLIAIGILAAVSSTAAAFCDKTMARLSDGKAALNSGNTTPPIR